nr:unnamed protein product [Sorex araneus]
MSAGRQGIVHGVSTPAHSSVLSGPTSASTGEAPAPPLVPEARGQLAAGTCEIVTLDRDSSQPRRTIARQTARCACRKGQIAGTTRARPACVDARIIRTKQWCDMLPCLDGEGCDLLTNRSGWTCTQPGGRIKTTTSDRAQRTGWCGHRRREGRAGRTCLRLVDAGPRLAEQIYSIDQRADLSQRDPRGAGEGPPKAPPHGHWPAPRRTDRRTLSPRWPGPRLPRPAHAARSSSDPTLDDPVLAKSMSGARGPLIRYTI